MPINQDAVNSLIDNSIPSETSNRVYFVEPANLMTAIDFFKRITGQGVPSLTSMNVAAGGFFFHTHSENIDGSRVNVTLRGGSSSIVPISRTLCTPSGDERSTYNLPGCTTLDITNPEALSNVPRFSGNATRVEFKFTQREEVVIAGFGN